MAAVSTSPSEHATPSGPKSAPMTRTAVRAAVVSGTPRGSSACSKGRRLALYTVKGSGLDCLASRWSLNGAGKEMGTSESCASAGAATAGEAHLSCDVETKEAGETPSVAPKAVRAQLIITWRGAGEVTGDAGEVSGGIGRSG